MIKGNEHSRFARGTKHTGRPLELKADAAAVVEGRTMFPSVVRPVDGTTFLLKPGWNSAKVGKRVTKGVWRSFPIYTLSLEERKTCPRSCKEWRICYGNHMPYAHRFKHGPKLEERLKYEVHRLAIMHPHGFVVRLHVLGDFYSVDYVWMWSKLLDTFKALRIFGYTARPRDGAIGGAVAALREMHGQRFSIRYSGVEAITIPGPLHAPKDAIICPAQTDTKPRYCGNCALCWTTDKVIAFMAH